MNCVRGDAVMIIRQALALGIMARPIGSPRVGVGEGISVTGGSFRIHCPGQPAEDWSPEPSEILLDWELTTFDLLVEEYRKATEEPW